MNSNQPTPGSVAVQMAATGYRIQKEITAFVDLVNKSSPIDDDKTEQFRDAAMKAVKIEALTASQLFLISRIVLEMASKNITAIEQGEKELQAIMKRRK